MNVTAEKIADVLGGQRALGRRVKTMRDLEFMIRDGIPKDALDALIDQLSDTRDLAQSDTRTLRNKIVPWATYQRVDRFNLQVSKTAERIARLYALLLSVLEDAQAATRFMVVPHPELEGRTPFDVALTEIGGRQVEEVIERGLHGLPA